MIQSPTQPNTAAAATEQNKPQSPAAGPQQTEAEKAKALADKAKADANVKS